MKVKLAYQNSCRCLEGVIEVLTEITEVKMKT